MQPDQHRRNNRHSQGGTGDLGRGQVLAGGEPSDPGALGRFIGDRALVGGEQGLNGRCLSRSNLAEFALVASSCQCVAGSVFPDILRDRLFRARERAWRGISYSG